MTNDQFRDFCNRVSKTNVPSELRSLHEEVITKHLNDFHKKGGKINDASSEKLTRIQKATEFVRNRMKQKNVSL